MNILLFSGSFRTASLNKKLMLVIHQELQTNPKLKLQIADLKSLSIPVYDGDVEQAGMPQGVTQLAQMIQEAQAIIITSPEYNGSMAGPLKNTIDWVSRVRPIPWEKKPILLTAASPGGLGAIRGLAHTRAPFEALGAYLYPSTFGLARAHEAFTPEGDLANQDMKKRLQELMTNFIDFAAKF